jgi:hypothetical protein
MKELIIKDIGSHESEPEGVEIEGFAGLSGCGNPDCGCVLLTIGQRSTEGHCGDCDSYMPLIIKTPKEAIRLAKYIEKCAEKLK